MTPTLRPELKDIPVRMMDLPVDPERGYPVPWFVDWIDGKPEFRAMDRAKWARAIKEKLCWVCGQRLGSYLTFVIGPMCGVNRTTTEPPCHLDCARWSAMNCPFLAKPHMVRRQHEEFTQEARSLGGTPIKRNPGVALLWTTRSYEIWKPASGEYLIGIGEPLAVEWYAKGRVAMRAEVEESVRTGLPILEEIARLQAGALEAMQKAAARLVPLYPKE
jgi:hypothetical protein